MKKFQNIKSVSKNHYQTNSKYYKCKILVSNEVKWNKIRQ